MEKWKIKRSSGKQFCENYAIKAIAFNMPNTQFRVDHLIQLFSTPSGSLVTVDFAYKSTKAQI